MLRDRLSRLTFRSRLVDLPTVTRSGIQAWTVAVLTFAVSAANAATPTTVDGIVAIVNDKAITRTEIDQEAALAVESKRGLLARRPEAIEKEIEKARLEALQLLVERQLILTEFTKVGYAVPENLVDEKVKVRLRERYGGDQAAMTRDLQNRGLTRERLRQMERERFIVSYMRSKNIAQEIIISPHKIEKYYADNLEKFKVGDQVKLRTIMVNKPPSGGPEAARRRIDEIHTKLAAGTSFTEMAAVYSEDAFRTQGGDRGWVDLAREHYHEELDRAIRALEPGQQSGVVETSTAFWIILLEDTRMNFTKTLPEVRAEIEATLATEERARIEKAWIDRLTAKSFVRYF